MLWVRIRIRERCTTLCEKVHQWLATAWWFSPGPHFSPTNKTDCHDITEIFVESGVKHHIINMIDSRRIHILHTNNITVNGWCSTLVFVLCVYLLIMPQISCLSENCSTRCITLGWVFYNSRYQSIKFYYHPTYYTIHDHLMYK